MYDGHNDGRDLVLSLPPLADQTVLELSDFLQALADLIADGYAMQLRRAWRERDAEREHLSEIHRFDHAQLALPFKDSPGESDPPF